MHARSAWVSRSHCKANMTKIAREQYSIPVKWSPAYGEISNLPGDYNDALARIH